MRTVEVAQILSLWVVTSPEALQTPGGDLNAKATTLSHRAIKKDPCEKARVKDIPGPGVIDHLDRFGGEVDPVLPRKERGAIFASLAGDDCWTHSEKMLASRDKIETGQLFDLSVRGEKHVTSLDNRPQRFKTATGVNLTGVEGDSYRSRQLFHQCLLREKRRFPDKRAHVNITALQGIPDIDLTLGQRVIGIGVEHQESISVSVEDTETPPRFLARLDHTGEVNPFHLGQQGFPLGIDTYLSDKSRLEAHP